MVNNITGERELTVHTAYLSKAQRTWLQDLHFAEQVYVLGDRDWLPLLLSDGDHQASDDDETLIGRQFVFTYANPEEQFSIFPPAPEKPQRPTGWRPYRTACELSVTGLRTGRKVITKLEKYYLDDNTAVFPAKIKNNLPGQEGYLALQNSADCQHTPFVNAGINQPGTYSRNNCGGDQEGTVPTIVIDGGTYGSELSQVDANSKAEAAWQALNTQAYANVHGACVINPQLYNVNVPANHFHNRSNSPQYMAIYYLTQEQQQTTMGNIWSLQNFIGSGLPYIFPQGTNDLDFPVTSDGYWFFMCMGSLIQTNE